MEYPKISIITPSYNQGAYIEKTIQSILNQGYPNLEYIIIDGGSKDDSVEIIKKYDEKIDYWVSEPDSGQSEAINKGFRKATGEIINWVNSDDFLEEKVLFDIANRFIKNDIHLLIGQSWNFDAQKKHLAGPKGEDVFERILVGYACPQPSTFMRKEALDHLGLLDEKLHYTMDWELYARIALNYNFLYVPEVYSWQLLHEEGKMVKDRDKFAEEGKSVFSKIINSFQFADEIKQGLVQLGYHKSSSSYTEVSSKISLPQLKQAFLLFLVKLSHHEYNILNTSQAVKNLRLLKQIDSNFYNQNKLRNLMFKARLPKSLLKVLKKS